jgi:hypothetical protein
MRRTIARLQFPPTPLKPSLPVDPNRDTTVNLEAVPTTAYSAFATTIGRGDEYRTLAIDLVSVDRTGKEVVVMKTYTDFILAGVTEGRAERADPTYTFGHPVTHTSSGEQPKIYVFQLNCLINKIDGDSALALMETFKSDIRASLLAKNGSRMVRMQYRNRVVYGAPVSIDIQYSAEQPAVVAAVLSVFVTDEYTR